MKYLYFFSIYLFFTIPNAAAWNTPDIPAERTFINSFSAKVPDPDSIWNTIDLTGRKFKDAMGIVVVRHHTWPYIVAGGVVVGTGVVLLTRKKEESNPPLPIAIDDQAGVSCGTNSIAIQVLSNDTGTEIAITSTTQPAGAVVTISTGGSVLVSNIGNESFSFSYTITDQSGQTASATVTVNVSDTQPPTITCPPTANIPCGSSTDPSVTGNPTVSDNCTPMPQITVTFSDQASGDQILRTWTGVDLVGNSASCVQTINFSDTQPPTITCPPTANVPCGSSTDPSVTGSPVATDNCTPTPQINVTFSDQASGDQILRTWTGVDLVGNSASCMQTINFSDTQPPTITCPPTANVPCGSSTDPSVTGNPTVSDNCTPTPQINVTFSDQASGDQILRTWTGVDLVGNSASCAQTINFSDTQPPTITCPPTANVPCGSSTDPSVTGSPTVSDNCTPTPQITVSFSDQASGDQILRTWTGVDLVGNSASCVQTINFSDTQPPTITCPPTANVPCGSSTDPSVTGNPTVTDNCTPTPQITVSFSDQTSGDQILRTWTGVDQVGNSASCVQTINFSDTQPPTISCPPTANVPCGSSTDPSVTGNPTVTDNCTPMPQITVTFSDQASGDQILRTWTGVDLVGNSASCVQTINFSDTQPPTITCPPTANVPCGSSTDPSVTGSPTVTDNCTPTPQITVSFSDQASGDQILRTWTGVDLVGNSASCVQTINFSDTQPPTITCPPTANVPCGSSTDPSVTGNPTVSDNCTPMPQITVSFSDQASGDQILRTWTGVDLVGNSASCVQTINFSDTQPPTITCPPTANVPCGSSTDPSVTGTPTVSDNCTPTPQINVSFSDQASGDQILRTWTGVDQVGNSASCVQTINFSDTQPPTITCPPTANVPCGSSTDPSVTGNPVVTDNCTPTPQITVSFSDQASGDQILRTWTGVDLVGNSASCVQTINFSDTQPPTITCPPTANVPCGSSTDPSVTGNPTVSDNCTPTPQITVSFSDQASGDQILRTWTGVDLVGNAASCVQTITFSDTQAPTITCPPNTALPVGTPPTTNNTGNPTVNDNCTPTPQIAVSFSDQTSGTGCAQVISRTWTATDQAGNAASCVQTITFSDTQAPTITCPPNTALPVGTPPTTNNTGNPTVNDNCTPTPQIAVSFSDQTSGTGCAQVISRTWIATDQAGNAASCVQTISFSDTQAPVITCPANAVLPVGTPPTPNNTGNPTATDNCTPQGQITFGFSDQSTGTGCAQVIQRTWTATDQAGNSASCVQTISFSDTQAPVITCPANAVLPVGTPPTPNNTGNPTATDNCTPQGQITFGFSDQSTGTGCAQVIQRTWTATDQAGNSASCVQTISFSDSQAPVITCPANAVLPVGTPPTPNNTGNPTATDNCTPQGQITFGFSDQSTGTGCAQVIQRTWTATDQAGNAASCVQTISFSDSQAPVITCPANVILSCGSPIDPSQTGFATATDNCSPPSQINISFSDLQSGENCLQTINRLWTAVDAAGNATSCTQQITLVDMESPIISCPPTISVSCGQEFDPTFTGMPTANDLCGSPVSFNFVDDLSEYNNCEGLITRTWLGMDICGNTSNCQQLIIVTLTLKESPPALLSMPIIRGFPSGSLIENLPELVAIQLPENPNLILQGNPGYTYSLPVGVDMGISWRPQWQIWGQLQTYHGNISYTLNSPGLPVPVYLTIPFNQMDSRLGLRLKGKARRATPYIGVAGQYQQLLLHNGAARLGDRYFPAATKDRHALWRVYLEAGIQLQAGKNACFEVNMERMPPTLKSATNTRFVHRLGVDLRILLNLHQKQP